jgi:hypothetical protein
MGMYTRLQLDLEIYPKFAEEVKSYIENTSRMRSSSYYFYDRGQHELVQDDAKSIWERGNFDRSQTAPMQVLHCDISLKNYTGEIEAYLELLNGKVHHGAGSDLEHVGSIRYEENVIPQLIFSTYDDTLVVKDITIEGVTNG